MKATLLEMNRKNNQLYRHHNKAILELLKLWGGPEKVYE